MEMLTIATKIHMNTGCHNSNILTDIDTIYLEGNDTNKLYKKGDLYDHLKQHPNSIQVYIKPYPYLVPVLSSSREKYVRSAPNDSIRDNLLKLPRV